MFPRWLSWLFVLFFAYMIYVGNKSAWHQQAQHPAEATSASPAEERDYPEIHALIDGERWKRALSPTYHTPDSPCAATEPEENMLPSYAIIERAGQGDAAACGDTVTLRLTYWNGKGQRGKSNPVATLTLGEQKGLDAMLVGITMGERRTLMFRAAESYAKLPALKPGVERIFTVERIAPKAVKRSAP